MNLATQSKESLSLCDASVSIFQGSNLLALSKFGIRVRGPGSESGSGMDPRRLDQGWQRTAFTEHEQAFRFSEQAFRTNRARAHGPMGPGPWAHGSIWQKRQNLDRFDFDSISILDRFAFDSME